MAVTYVTKEYVDDKIGNGVGGVPQPIQYSTNYVDGGIYVSRTYRGDTTSKIYARWTDMLKGSSTNINGIYVPAPSDQTIYGIVIPDEYLSNNVNGASVGFYTTPDFVGNTRIWYDTFQPQNSELAIDEIPTENSSNLVKSGGVYAAIQNAGGNEPQMLGRSITPAISGQGVSIQYNYRGDMAGTLKAFYAFNPLNGYTEMTSAYMQGSTLYVATTPAFPDGDTNVNIVITKGADASTSIDWVWTEVYTLPAETADLSNLVTSDTFNTELNKKADKYYIGKVALTDLAVGQSVGGKFINFDIPDFDFSDDADGGYAQYDAITFSDGSRIRFENSSWYYMAEQVGISLPTIIHTIVEGGNYWTDSSFTFPEGLTITAIDPRWLDSPMSKGHLQDSPTDTTTTVVDCEYNYNSTSFHKATDRFRWQDAYDGERDSVIRDAALDGLKPNEDARVSVPAPSTPNTVSDEAGGVMGVTFTNQGDSFAIININGDDVYSSEGLTDGVPVTKYFWLRNGDMITTTNAETIDYTPFTKDTESHIAIMQSQIDSLIASDKQNKNDILDIKASIANLQPDTQNIITVVDKDSAIDITSNGTFTANSTLGGRINGEGYTLLGLFGIKLVATGYVDITLSSARTINGTSYSPGSTVRVYDNTALIGGAVSALVIDVENGDVITTSGMNTLIFTPYIAKVS